MGKPLRSLIRNTLFRDQGNLVSLDDAFVTMKRLLNGHVVSDILDAGASDGRISRKMLRQFPNARSWLFEPHPAYRERLEQLHRENPRYNPQFLALSDSPGTIDFFDMPRLGETSRFAPSERLIQYLAHASSPSTKTTVPAVRLDDWHAENGRPPIQVMKYDIQAGELLAMRGATQILESSVLLVYTEVYFNPMYEGGALFGEVDQFLRERGFVLYNLYGLRSDKNDMLAWGNAIFVHAQRMKL